MFLFRGRESHPRSFVKAVSWRALGSIDTFRFEEGAVVEQAPVEAIAGKLAAALNRLKSAA